MSDPDISIHYTSPQLAAETVTHVITLPTFRRPELLVETLNSLTKQNFPGHYAVVVIENDAERCEGAAAAATFLEQQRLGGIVIIAHERGNCHAYNAGWHVTLETFRNLEAIAVIDDDELADPHWLARLTEAQQSFDVDLVGGPQLPVFENKHHEDWRWHPVFTPAYAETGTVPILFSSGNVLISRRVLEAMPQPFLDPVFNFIGGGDSDFYSRARLKGFRFAWCAEAPVYESVPARRVTRTWLTARSQREGAISALIERRRHPDLWGRAKIFAKSMAMLAASPFRSARLWASSGSAITGSYFVHAAIGRFIAEFGEINEQYRNPESN